MKTSVFFKLKLISVPTTIMDVCAVDVRKGYSSVFGSNKCKECSDSTLGLLVFFAIAGVGLIVIISVFHITITDGYCLPLRPDDPVHLVSQSLSASL